MDSEQKPIERIQSPKNTSFSIRSLSGSSRAMIIGLVISAAGFFLGQIYDYSYSTEAFFVLVIGAFFFIFGIVYKFSLIGRLSLTSKSSKNIFAVYWTFTILGIPSAVYLFRFFIMKVGFDSLEGVGTAMIVMIPSFIYLGFWLFLTMIMSAYNLWKIRNQQRNGEIISQVKLFSYFLFFLITTVVSALLLLFTIV